MNKVKMVPLLLLAAGVEATAQRQSVERAECFIGADPGIGKGIPIQIDAGDAVAHIPWDSLPPIGYDGLVYVRVRSSGFIDVDGKTVEGVWSMPTAIRFPTQSVLRAAEVKISRPGLSYPLREEVYALDGAFDSVVEHIRTRISLDSLQVDDTLFVRLQGHDEVWGDWVPIPIRGEYMQLPAPTNLTAHSSGSTPPRVELNWEYAPDNGETGFEVERRSQGGSWNLVGSAARNATSYPDNDPLIQGREYLWRVRAVGIRDVMLSEYSNEATVSVSDVRAPSPAWRELRVFLTTGSSTVAVPIATSEAAQTPTRFVVSNILGQTILTRTVSSEEWGSGRIHLAIEVLPPGIYICTIQFSEHHRTILLAVH